MSVIAKKVSKLQNKIIQAQKDLSEINKLEQPLPEFINTTNMLRSNEYLQKANKKKTQLLIAYENYTRELENLVSNIAQIRGNLNHLKSRFKARKTTKRKAKKRKKPRKRKSIRRKTRKRRR